MKTTPKHQQSLPLWAAWRSHGKAINADFILNYFEVRKAPIPVREIVVAMGVSINRLSVDDASGAVELRDGRARIWTNAREAEVRQRFTIAHELGHLLLHVSEGTPEFRDSKYSNFNQSEVEANQFAADLLMPAWLMWKVASVVGRSARSLAVAFEVSQAAMEYRMRNVKMGF